MTRETMTRRLPDPEGLLPLLPDPVLEGDAAVATRGDLPGQPISLPWPPGRRRRLRAGCYLLRYTPTQLPMPFNALHYDGTLRVQRDGSNVIASGDLYHHRTFRPWPIPPLPGSSSIFPPLFEPNPGAGIPIFARGAYRYYIRVTQIQGGTTRLNRFTMGFELHRFDPATRTWTNEGAFTAVMNWTPAPAGYPSSDDYLSGSVGNALGAAVGTLIMGWVSPYLRRATVEIDRVALSETCLNNGAGLNWRAVFDEVGWDITVDESNANVVEPSVEGWSNAEMHAEMLARRDAANLDVEWRYHVLCVRILDATSRGIMYDAGGTDSNNVPREGVGISSHWVIPNSAMWGLVQGLRFGTAIAPYFRTALHEVGHAMGLYHNTIDHGIMNTTDVIAASATPPVQFPNNIQWSYAPDDQKRLRHLPDIWVRPGGVPFGASYSTAPISPGDLIEPADGLAVEVKPLVASVPIGAPVRVGFTLINTTGQPLPVPASLSLKSGFVKGKVVDAAGTVRTFRPIMLCVEDHELSMLAAGERRTQWLTLLRGAQGALFPTAGPCRVIVEVEWDIGGSTVGLTGETSVMVTGPVDAGHAAAALKILSTPDALLALAVGGDHLADGVAAIDAGLSHPALRPHYAIIEAKRVGRRFRSRRADFRRVTQLIDDSAVLSPAETRTLAELVRDAGREAENEPGRRLVKVLHGKVDQMIDEDETARLVKAL